YDLMAVLLEDRGRPLLERYSDRGGGMVMRTALQARKDGLVDLLGDFVAAEDHRAAWPAQRFVRGGGDDIGVGHGVRMRAGDDQSRDVRDVGQHEGADLFRNLTEDLEIELARISGRSGDDNLRPFFFREIAHRVVVDSLTLAVDLVVHRAPEDAGRADRPSVSQMAAVRQRQ